MALRRAVLVLLLGLISGSFVGCGNKDVGWEDSKTPPPDQQEAYKKYSEAGRYGPPGAGGGAPAGHGGGQGPGGGHGR